MPRIYELLHPSGHRQVWREVDMATPGLRLYECTTFSPEGDLLEFRVLSAEQLERTAKRVRRSGGEVSQREAD
jgi:hypothetical protein